MPSLRDRANLRAQIDRAVSCGVAGLAERNIAGVLERDGIGGVPRDGERHLAA
ncbi:hypothetical protein ABID26_006344 [Mesorhizobium shonense]|uniref:Uncharacterized protein n=1 Tax=Mesorhizobium shonense TaxID=1209948 RepID=A0ABV2I1W9_9HYPH